ncbi:ficolin-1 [Elysia marginata]|uniref:Ficolin-1 n=1 Tax=Elysia marginata TaxID=1093978 RepID=A0AAV4G5A2_9GAST|nr:ficolin-1 [Elysia marginata]
MNVRKAVYLFLLLVSTVNVGSLAASITAEGLKLSLDRDISTGGRDGMCGQLTCQASGHSVTISSLTITVFEISGSHHEMLAVTKTEPDMVVNVDAIRGNGTLKSNQALAHLNLLTTEVCDSYYFTCQVNFTALDGHAHQIFTMTGPGTPPRFQAATHTDQKHPVTVTETKFTPPKTDNLYLSELWFLGEKITKVEGKFETLRDRLDKRLRENIEAVQSRAGTLENSVLKRVSSVETDFSSRVSRLEDRLSSILLAESPDTRSEVAQSLADMERRLDDVTEKLDQTNATKIASSEHVQQSLEDTERRLDKLTVKLDQINVTLTSLEQEYQFNQPSVCERGMGDDVTKQYAPYVIMFDETLGRDILCDTHTDGGGWIVFQRRAVGDVDFYKDWSFYKDGFGSLTGDFWLGNDAIHALTDKHPYELRLDMRHKGQEVFAAFSNFRIGNEASKYKLQLGPLIGSSAGTGDGLTYHAGMPFSTFDRDNDVHSTAHCAVAHRGGWWYRNCHGANLNGAWGVQSTVGASWNSGAKGWWYLTFTEIKIRRSTGRPRA